MRTMSLYMDQFSLEVVSNISESICCVICHDVLKSPQYGPCGCRYCLECINNFLTNEDRMCPGSTEECKVSSMNLTKDVHPDPRAKREVSKLMVRCPFRTCGEEYEFRVMKDHLKMCAISIIVCQDCHGTFNREEFDNHVDYECMDISVTCEFCHMSMTRRVMTSEHHNYEHGDLCQQLVNYCPNECGEVQKVLWTEHRQGCSNRTVSCPYHNIGCPTNTGTLTDITKHLQKNAMEHGEIILKHIDNLNNEISCLNGYVAGVTSDIAEIKQEHDKKLKLELEKHATGIRNIDKKVEEMTREQSGVMPQLRNFVKRQVTVVMNEKDREKMTEIEKLKSTIRTMRLSIERLKEGNSESSLGSVTEIKDHTLELDCARKSNLVLIWVIDRFSETIYIESPSFYTEIMGYKLDVALSRRDINFISIFLRLKCGEFDKWLQWPFRKCVTVRIVDQDKLGRDFDKAIPFNSLSGRASERKYFAATGDYGFRDFISKDALYGKEYLMRHDKLCVACFVDDLDT